MSVSRSFLLLGLVSVTIVVLALQFGHDPVAAEAQRPLIHRDDGYVGSTACKTCHPDHHASWSRTFHATMTQRPSPATVLGDFGGQEVRYGRDKVRLLRDGDRFSMQLTGPDQDTRTAEVALTVGSRRYQQYFEQREQDGSLSRLPVLWHVALRRWLPLETVFLEPDAEGLGSHASVWNDNCILCHNTGPRPNMLNLKDPARMQTGGCFDSEVGELGIACEACHGPGARHAAEWRNPLARLTGGVATAMHDLEHMDQERAIAACGQCHGARLPEPITRMHAWFTTGPTYRVGDRLLDHVAPIRRDTKTRGNIDPETFSLRFWGDGTPRLTAYEFQGITDSTCYRDAAFTCQSCHTMHDGDPRGQLRPDRAGDAMCTQCHAAIAADVPAHTHHAAGSAGSSCVACHMPKIVFGVLDVHRSHRIDNPEPARDAASQRPHACTLCHVDRSIAWSATVMRQWWGERYVVPDLRADGAPIEMSDAAAMLLTGDAAARAIVASALGEPGIVFGTDHDAAVRAWLAVTLGDAYPSVRYLAQRSLRALEDRVPFGLAELLHRTDHLAVGEGRRQQIVELLEGVAATGRRRGVVPAATSLLGADFQIDLPAVIRLTDLQGRNRIAIGE